MQRVISELINELASRNILICLCLLLKALMWIPKNNNILTSLPYCASFMLDSQSLCKAKILRMSLVLLLCAA